MIEAKVKEVVQYKFHYSVVIACYNCAPYLEKTILNMVNQTLSFEKHIQLILVNDGSTDKTEEVCLQYKNLYPQNIVYVCKKNGGVSTARNEGLKHVEGEYVNFCDSDDYLDTDTMEKVDAFRHDFGEASDVICFNIVHFEGASGSWINEPFFKNSQVLNLIETPAFIQHSVCSAFIKASVAKNQVFSTDLRILEDAHYLYRILIDNPICGLVANTTYWHRVRKNQTSATQNINHHDNILSMMGHLFPELCNQSLKKYGNAPEFLQYMMLGEIYYYVLLHSKGVAFSEEEKEDITKQLRWILGLIDRKVIYGKEHLNYGEKYFVEKVKKYPEILLRPKNCRKNGVAGMEKAFTGMRVLLNSSRILILLYSSCAWRIEIFGCRFKMFWYKIGFFIVDKFCWLGREIKKWARLALWKIYDIMGWFSKKHPALHGFLKKLLGVGAPPRHENDGEENK